MPDDDLTWDDLFWEDGDLRSTEHPGEECEVCEARHALRSGWFDKPDGCAMPTRGNVHALYRDLLPEHLRD